MDSVCLKIHIIRFYIPIFLKKGNRIFLRNLHPWNYASVDSQAFKSQSVYIVFLKIYELFYILKNPWLWIPYVWEFTSLDSISRKVYVSGFIWIEYIQVWILPLEKSNNLVSISLTIHKFWIPYPWKSTSVDSLFF